MALPTKQVRVTQEAADALREYAKGRPESATALASVWLLERVELEERRAEERAEERRQRRQARRSG